MPRIHIANSAIDNRDIEVVKVVDPRDLNPSDEEDYVEFVGEQQ